MSTGKLKRQQQEAQQRRQEQDEACRRVGAPLEKILLFWKRGDPLPPNADLCTALLWSLERKPAAFEAAVYFARRLPKLLEYEESLRGFAALLYQYDAWIEDWRHCSLQSHNVPRALSSLARRLLCRYPTPTILDEALNQGPESPYLDWFRLIGNGTSVLKLPHLPVTFTKKQAHCFLQAPPGLTLIQGIRYGQLKPMGASEALIAAVNRTFLGREIDPAPFWDTLLLFLAQNANFLTETLVGQVVDFVRAQVEVNPNYSLKGRTIHSLLKATMEWHDQMGNALFPGHYPWYFRKNTRNLENYSWAGQFAPWTLEYPLKNNMTRVYLVTELCSLFDLIAEGNDMHHCVASYSLRCLHGQSRILSLRELTVVQIIKPDGTMERETVTHKRLATLEYAPTTKTIVQAQMAFNRPPDPETNAVIHQWAAQQKVRYPR